MSTIRDLLAEYETHMAERGRVEREEPHSSRAWEGLDDAALTLLHKFADATAVLDVRPAGLVDPLALAFATEWPDTPDDYSGPFTRSFLRLLLDIDVSWKAPECAEFTADSEGRAIPRTGDQ